MPDLHGVGESPEEGIVPGLRFAPAASTPRTGLRAIRPKKKRPATGGRRRLGRNAGGVGSWREAAGERRRGILRARRRRAAAALGHDSPSPRADRTGVVSSFATAVPRGRPADSFGIQATSWQAVRINSLRTRARISEGVLQILPRRAAPACNSGCNSGGCHATALPIFCHTAFNNRLHRAFPSGVLGHTCGRLGGSAARGEEALGLGTARGVGRKGRGGNQGMHGPALIAGAAAVGPAQGPPGPGGSWAAKARVVGVYWGGADCDGRVRRSRFSQGRWRRTPPCWRGTAFSAAPAAGAAAAARKHGRPQRAKAGIKT